MTGVMEPVLDQYLENNRNTIYQVKWDGVRMLCFVEKGEVILQNRRGRIKTAAFPELNSLGEIDRQPLVLDGEIVVLKNGRPDFAQVLRRNFSARPGLGAPPISYIVFDILRWQGEDIRGKCLAERQELLARVRFPPEPASVIDNFRDGVQLMALTRERAWEGVVAKDIDSSYVAGKSPYWRKYKNQQRDIFTIVGYLAKQGQLSSLLVAKDFGEGLVLTGSVGSGLSNVCRRMLMEIFPMLILPEPPLQVPEKTKAAAWLEPVLQAEVVFMEWTEALTLRAPVLKALLLEGKRYELS